MTIDFKARLRQRREDKKIDRKRLIAVPPLEPIEPLPPSTDITWNAGQAKAIKELGKLFIKDEPQTAILTGSAGTGKTTLCLELNRLLKPAFCALTHKAAAVLAEKSGAEVSTLARVLKMRKYNDLDTGDTRFRGSTSVDLDQDVILIDETSMMGEDYFEQVKTALVGRYHVLFIGDRYQLPPVNEEFSKALALDVPAFQLTEPVRFDEGSGIDKTAEAVREAMHHKHPRINGMKMILRQHDDVLWVSADKAVPMMIEAFKKQKGVDDVRMISFTNKRVEAFNYHLKKAVTGDAERIKPGDLLMANETYSEEIAGEEVIVLLNNQSTIVKAVEEVEHRGMPAYHLTIGNGRKLYVPINRQEYLFKVEEMKSAALRYSKGSIERKNEFRQMFRFKEGFADLRLNYAQTVHKAQGSTYDTCFFDLTALDTNSSLGRRLLYTGITRAAKKLVLFK